MRNRIEGLSNEDYHYKEPFTEYISSTMLKKYLMSPKAFKYAMDNRMNEPTESTAFGSLFHAAMESFVNNGDRSIFMNNVAIFEPPLNPSTQSPYGANTKAYKEAYSEFLSNNEGKIISDTEEIKMLSDMMDTITDPSVGGITANKVLKLINRSLETEVSYFLKMDNGVKLKVRPDMLTSNKIIDWKTCSLETMDEYNICNQIIKYRYDISMSMYQYVLHLIKGIWYEPLLVFVSKVEPYDALIVDLSEWCYSYNNETELVRLGVGALDFSRLLNTHAKCIEEKKWEGITSSLKPSDQGIMKAAVPLWFEMKVTK